MSLRDTPFRPTSSRSRWHYALAGLVVVGMAFRIAKYAAQRCMWLDEVSLALNLMVKPFSRLFWLDSPPQFAPIGFLFIQKVIGVAFGYGEHAMRFVPFVAGVLSLLLFTKLSWAIWRNGWAVPAVAFFALSRPLIYYAAEAKQYSSDVLVALLLYVLIAQYPRHSGKSKSVWPIAICGILAVWMSHSSVFVLAGVGAILLADTMLTRSERRIWSVSAVVLSWGVSFLIYYFALIRKENVDAELVAFWRPGFMPLDTDLGTWVWQSLTTFAEYPGGFYIPIVALILSILGGISFALRDKWQILGMLGLPFVFVLASSSLQLYPFLARMVLFLVPAFLLLVTEGIFYTYRSVPRAVRVAVAGLLIAALLARPTASAVKQLDKQPLSEEILPVMHYYHDNKQAGDILYLYHGAYRGFKYYSLLNGTDTTAIVGNDHRTEIDNYGPDIRRVFGNPRVWVLFSHIWVENGVDEEMVFKELLNNQGAMLDSFGVADARVYLYDLSGQSAGLLKLRSMDDRVGEDSVAP